MKFSLRQLEVFAAVSRCGNVTRAAEALSLSQSAASTSLGELERQFDCQLFDRAGKSLRLNELGRQLLPRAVEMLDRAEEIEALLHGQAGFGELRIGATLTIGNYLATLIVADYLRHHADSRVSLTVHNTADILGRLAGFELDLGLVEGEVSHPDLATEPWVEDEMCVFAAPGHPLAGQAPVSLDALLAENWIVRESGSGTRETLDLALGHRRSELRVRLELEHTEAIKRAVEAGLGLGCISRLALRDAFRRGSLVPIATPELDLRRLFRFVWHHRKFQTAGMRAFLQLCREVTAGARSSDDIVLPAVP